MKQHASSAEIFDSMPATSVDLAEDDNLTEEEEDTKIPDLECPICIKTFTRPENIVLHLTSKKHRANITSNNNSLAAQLYTKYHADLMKKAAYQCAHCQFAAAEHEDLLCHLKSQQHNENVMELVGPLECVHCTFLDYDGNGMLTHCSGHGNLPSVIIRERKHKIECQECGKVLHSTVHYKRHMRLQHSANVKEDDAMLKQCDYCPFKGKRTTVNKHIAHTHRDHRPYHCEMCQTDFHSRYDLNKHYSTKKHIEQAFDHFKTFLPQFKQLEPFPSTTGSPVKCSVQAMRCKFCPFTTSDISRLQSHYVSLHEEFCPMVEEEEVVVKPSSASFSLCRYCHKQCNTRSEKYQHEANHIIQVRYQYITQWLLLTSHYFHAVMRRYPPPQLHHVALSYLLSGF